MAKQKGFRLNLDDKKIFFIAKKRKVLTLTLILLVFIIGGICSVANKGQPVMIGTAITTAGLEAKWTEEHTVLLPGVLGKINVNTADQETLEALPGVGEKIAQAIISYREENGRFHSLDEIVNVSGIGIKKRDKMKEFVVVE